MVSHSELEALKRELGSELLEVLKRQLELEVVSRPEHNALRSELDTLHSKHNALEAEVAEVSCVFL